MNNYVKVGSMDKIKLFVSDIDGTLIPFDKKLTKETLEAAKILTQVGVKLCLVSSRPSQGIKFYLKELNIDTPYAALNGGEIITMNDEILSTIAMERKDAEEINTILLENKINSWLFGGFEWGVFNLEDPFTLRETSVIRHKPTLIHHFSQFVAPITKIEGVSPHTELLDAIAEQINRQFSSRIKAVRSSKSYLDITHIKANKGFAIQELGRLMNINLSQIACIGDMDNDIPMLEIAGLSISMGQSSDKVDQYAHFKTKSNEENGWAYAVKNYILPRV